VELLAPRPNHNLEDQWTILSLAFTVWTVWFGWPCLEITLPPA